MDKETRPWTQLARQFILIFESILVIVIWLEGISIVHTAQNQTLMSGSLRDQVALYGLIIKLRDLGVKIVSMNFSDNSCQRVRISTPMLTLRSSKSMCVLTARAGLL